MADLAAIREAIAAALNDLPDAQAYAYRPDTINPPVLVVEPEEVSFKEVFGRGHELWTLNVIALLATVSNLAGQQERDKYFGGIRDVVDAIEDHTSLNDGTVAEQTSVVRAESFDTLSVAQIDYIGVVIIVQVLA